MPLHINITTLKAKYFQPNFTGEEAILEKLHNLSSDIALEHGVRCWIQSYLTLCNHFYTILSQNMTSKR